MENLQTEFSKDELYAFFEKVEEIKSDESHFFFIHFSSNSFKVV